MVYSSATALLPSTSLTSVNTSKHTLKQNENKKKKMRNNNQCYLFDEFKFADSLNGFKSTRPMSVDFDEKICIVCSVQRHNQTHTQRNGIRNGLLQFETLNLYTLRAGKSCFFPSFST